MTDSRAINSFFWSLLEQGGAKVVQLIVQVVLARLLAPEAFGLLAVLLVITQVADSIAQSGFGMALIQKVDATDRSFDTAFWLSIGVAAALYAVIFPCAPLLASFYGMPDLVATLRVLALAVLFNAANSIQRSYMQKRMDFRGLFRVSFAATVGSGVVGVAAAVVGWGVWALVAQVIAQSVFTCIAMCLLVPWRPHFRFCGSEARELYGYGWKVCITGILNVFYTGVSELILGKACSAAELGYYSQGRKYPAAAIGVMTNGIANVLLPAFSKAKGDLEYLHELIHQGLRLGTFVVAPVSLCAAVIAEPIVVLLLGENWLPCVSVFALACAGNSILMLQLVNLRAFMALGRSDLYLALQIAKVSLGILGVGGTALLTHDIYATAWAAFFVGIIGITLIDLHPSSRVIGYSRMRQIADILPVLLLAAMAALGSWMVTWLHLSYAIELLLQVVAYALLYVGGAKLLHFSELDDALEKLRPMFRRIKR